MFDVIDSMTVTDLKELVAEKAEVPVEKQRLLYKGKQIEEGTLHDWGMDKDDKVELVLRLRAGVASKRVKKDADSEIGDNTRITQAEYVEKINDELESGIAKVNRLGTDRDCKADVLEHIEHFSSRGAEEYFKARVNEASIEDLATAVTQLRSTSAHRTKFASISTALFHRHIETVEGVQKQATCITGLYTNIVAGHIVKSDAFYNPRGVDWNALANYLEKAKNARIREEGTDGRANREGE